MNKKIEPDYKSLYERQVKALKILNERLRKKEKEITALNLKMRNMRHIMLRKIYESELKQRIDKAIEFINNNQLFDFEYDEEELFEYVTDLKVKENLRAILKDSDVDE